MGTESAEAERPEDEETEQPKGSESKQMEAPESEQPGTASGQLMAATKEVLKKAAEEAAKEQGPVKGIYVTGPFAGHANMENLIQLADDSELNAMVIDIKNDEGIVTYKMEEPMVQELGADVNYITDLPGLVQRLSLIHI